MITRNQCAPQIRLWDKARGCHRHSQDKNSPEGASLGAHDFTMGRSLAEIGVWQTTELFKATLRD